MGILQLFLFCLIAEICIGGELSKNEWGYELGTNGLRVAKCKNTEILDPKTMTCYNVKERGPCGINMRFYRHEENPLVGECRCIKRLWWEPPLVFWPQRNQCYQLFTQGPCDSGEWLVLDRHVSPTCAIAECEGSSAWSEQYPRFTFTWNQTCYTTGTQSICPPNNIIMFDPANGPLCFSTSYAEVESDPVDDPSLGSRSPRCAFTHQAYDPVRGKCYLTNVQGPCGDSMVFARTENNFYHGQCRCIEQSPYQPPLILSRDHNQCFRLFSQGPCRDGEWLIPGSDDSYVSSGAICAPDKCSNGSQSLEVGQYNFIYDNTCYVGGSQGVCPEKLILGYEKMGPICYEEGIQQKPLVGSSSKVAFAPPLPCPDGMELTATNGCARRTRLRPRSRRDFQADILQGA